MEPGSWCRRPQCPTRPDVVRSGPWLRWTGRVRTAVDLIRRDGTDEAVVLLGRLVCARMVDLGAVRAAVEALPRRRGSAYARRAATLADGLAESPPETRLRLLLHRSGLPLPVARYEVRCAGRASSRGSTSRGRSGVSRWSTTGPGAEPLISYRGTGVGSTVWRLATGGVHFVTKNDLRRPDILLADLSRALSR